MTLRDLILYGPGWAAMILLPVHWIAERRFRRRMDHLRATCAHHPQ